MSPTLAAIEWSQGISDAWSKVATFDLEFAKTVATVAGGAIVGVGFFAALNQLQIAPDIVNGLFYAVLAVVAGSVLIAVGGGGIKPMQQRWEKALGRWDEGGRGSAIRLQVPRTGSPAGPRS